MLPDGVAGFVVSASGARREGRQARGADTERVNQRGQTALISAVFRQSEPNVRALLAAGADPNTGSPDAYATADFFDLPAMRALLGGRRV